MIVSFDPTNADERSVAARIIAAMAPQAATAQTETPLAAATAQTETPVTNGHDPEPAPVMDATAGVEVDKNGTPWLAEVHSGNKKMTAKGVWQKKRGIDDAVLKAAEEAARAKVAGTPEPTPTAALQPPVTEPAPVVVSMDDVSMAWTACMTAGILTAEQAPAVYAQLGIDPATLTTNETTRATFVNYLNGLLAAQAAPTPAAPGIPGVS